MGKNHLAAGRRDYLRSAGSRGLYIFGCRSFFLWLHRRALRVPPPLYVKMSRLILKKTQADAGSRLSPESSPVQHVVVQDVGAHGFLRDGVDGEHTATHEILINVQYSIDEYVWSLLIIECRSTG